MRYRTLLSIFVLISCMQAGRAQIITASQDPARIRWNQIRTASYKFIYPEGYDSLAVSCARLYESFSIPVSATSGFTPARIPVVLHPANASTDYGMTLLPARIDMPVLPQGHLQFSLPVTEMAAVYLSRRAAHLQYGQSNVFRPFRQVFGELVPLAAMELYTDQWMLHGDAAIAATTLVPGGYGRYGEFLNYYMAALDAGDVRNWKWDRWAIGSPKYYTPGQDAFGYMIMSGLRTMYDSPYYIRDYLEYTSKRPYDIFAGSRLDKRITGGSLHKDVFRKILDCHGKIFSSELEGRAPFTVSAPVLEDVSGKYAEYSSTAVLPDGTLYTVRKSLDRSPCLVRISPGGKQKRISSFTESCSRLVWSETLGRLFWSETEDDLRWKQKQVNIIRYYDPGTGRTGRLKTPENVYNPALSPDGTFLAAVHGSGPGRTSVVIMDASTGKVLRELPESPSGVLFGECAWAGGDIYASGVSLDGAYIFMLSEGGETGKTCWKEIIGPVRCTVRNLGAWKEGLVFSCDISGVFDLYRIQCGKSSGSVVQKLTSEKFGSRDFVFASSGDTLYYSRLDNLGYRLRKTPARNLSCTLISLYDRTVPVISRELEEQEEAALAVSGTATVDKGPDITEPRRYRKGLHLFRLHSRAPLYCNIDRLDDMSGEKLYNIISIGATVLSQNTLGTAYGSAGYSWKPDPDGYGWVHGGHLSFTYAGWYPVIAGNLYINDRMAWNYTLLPDGNIARQEASGPSIAGKIDLYVPLSRETGGKSCNFVPVVSWELDNSRYDGHLNHRLTLSGRFWLLRDKAKAEIYPRYGIGAEAGITMALSGGRQGNYGIKLSDSWYFHSYGYFPGFFPGQGGKFAVTTQMRLSRGIYNPASEILPRGLGGSITRGFYNPSFATLLSLDYAVPVYLGDINITRLIYLNRMVVTPHFDYGFSAYPKMHLCSAGASLTFQLGRLLWAFPVEIGVDYSYNFGTLFSVMEEKGSRVVRHSVRPVIKFNF